MKKYLSIIIVLIILIIIGGFFYFNQQLDPANQNTKDGSSKNDVFSSIKDAMSKSLSLKCEYEGDGGKTTAYIKGNTFRAITQVISDEEKIGNIIMKDNKMWLWNDGDIEGILFEINQEKQGANGDSLPEQTDRERILEELERYKDKCSTTVISDSLFIPPSKVVFKDLSTLEEEMMKGLENITGMPSVPSENTSE